MLDADGGGGYGGTDWMSKNVVEMWQAIESQDTTAHYQMLTGWKRSYELMLQHMSQVKGYRNNLAAAWPPEKSPASAAYLQRVDALITSLQSTYDAAVANHSAFASATLAITLSRNDVKKIYDEYTANQTKLDAFNAEPRPVQYGKTPVVPPRPPVQDGRQEQLNNQARSIMFGLSGEIIQARGQFTKPPMYNPEQLRADTGDDDGTKTHTPPPIPPITTFDPNSSNAASSLTVQHSATHTSNANVEAPTTAPSVGRQPGLVLGGTQPAPTIPSTPTPGLTPTPPLGGGALPNMITPSPILPTPPKGSPSGGFPPPAAGMMKTSVGGGLGRPGMGGMPEGGMRAMPPGGIIGGAPGVGLAQPATSARPASRVNPVGGVIHPNNSQSRVGSVSHGTASGQPMGSRGGRTSSRRDHSDETLCWDPNNPWEMAEGVSPVVLPEAEQKVDPGPAIGLP